MGNHCSHCSGGFAIFTYFVGVVLGLFLGVLMGPDLMGETWSHADECQSHNMTYVSSLNDQYDGYVRCTIVGFDGALTPGPVYEVKE